MKKMAEENSKGIYINSDLYKDSFDYYNLKFMDMPGVSWNWSSFIYGYIWFAYRKMYFGALIFAVLYAFCFGLTVLMPELGALVLVIHLICGLFGDAFYYFHVKKLSAKISKLDKRDAKDFVRKKGGSSVPSIVVFGIISSLLVGIVKIVAEILIDV